MVVPPTGVDERSTPDAGRRKQNATIVRNGLFVPGSLFTLHSSFFDMTGRQVMALKPGANDVSRLSPGVYFVREQTQAASLKPQVPAVHRVVITR